MSKRSRVVSAVVFGVAAAGGLLYYGSKNKEKLRRRAEGLGAKGVDAAFGAVAKAIPGPPDMQLENYQDDAFMPGHEEFRETSRRGVRWSLGYARRSIVPQDWREKPYYIAGYLAFPPNVMQGVQDDQALRVIVLDDSSQRGSVVFVNIDCVGISLTDVRAIRRALQPFAEENGIVSINVCATHVHSGVDTQGIWGDIGTMLKTNVKALREKRYDETVSGKDKAYMAFLTQQAVEAVEEAFADKRKGQMLYYRTKDYPYARDKREPDVKVEDILKLHFVPSDGSRETVAVCMAAHPTALGEENRLVSGDFVYYMEKEVNDENANFIFFQGPELAIAQERSKIIPQDAQDHGYRGYGKTIGHDLMEIKTEDETKVLPLLNIRLKEVFVPCDNKLLESIVRLGVLNNTVLKNGKQTGFITEVGYMELGKNLCFALIPGEMAPELLLGGAFTAQDSYNREAWTLPAMREMVDETKHLSVLGLCNDSIGYILPDNDYGSYFAKGHYEEIVSAGKRAGSTLLRGFQTLLQSLERGV